MSPSRNGTASYRAVVMLIWREAVRFMRQPHRVAGALGQPLVFWLLFGAGLHRTFQVPGMPQGKVSFLEYFFPGALALVLLFTAIFATISIIEDRREGFLQGVLVAPIGRWAIVLGKVSGTTLIALAHALLFMICLAWIPVTITVTRFALLAALLTLTSIGMSSLGVMLAWRMNSTQGFHAVMNVLLIPMWLLSGAFFPPPPLVGGGSTAQQALAVVMWGNPLTYSVAGTRHLLAHPDTLQALALPSPALCWLVTGLFASVAFAAAWWVVTSRQRPDRRHGILLVLAVATVLFPWHPIAAQPPSSIPSISVDQLSNTARAHLEQAQTLLANGDFADAIGTLRQVMDTDGDAMIAVNPLGWEQQHGFVRYLPVRDFGQAWLADLGRSAPEALRLYRAQVDDLADHWWQQAQQDPIRASKWYRRIVRECLNSSVGDDALWRLGEWALERGEYQRARLFWEQMSPLLRFPVHDDNEFRAAAGRPLAWVLRDVDWNDHQTELLTLLSATEGRPDWPCYGDTSTPLADVRARLVLVSILEGDQRRAETELDLLRRLSPDMEGHLGRRRGRWVEILEEMLRDSAAWPAPQVPQDWPTFAGSPSRNGRRPGGTPVVDRHRWKAALPVNALSVGAATREGIAAGEPLLESLSYHPVVAGNRVFVATGDNEQDIIGMDLSTGNVVFGKRPLVPGPRKPPARKVVERRNHYTMTIAGSRLYARVAGAGGGSAFSRRTSGDDPGQIVAWDLNAEGKRVLQIRLEGPSWEGTWSFGGSPVVAGARLYVALWRHDPVRKEAHVASFDAQSGRLLWRRFVVAGQPLDREAVSRDLLSLNEGTLYYNSNLGAVAALEAEDGVPLWVVAYPRAGGDETDLDEDQRYRQRDLTPCLVHRDRVYVAPRDTARIFALDAATGHVLWTTRPAETAGIVHLLGVGQGNLIASGDELVWLNADTGRCVGRFPVPRRAMRGHGRVSPRGCGRGVLVGPYVYWPTRDKLFVFHQKTKPTELGWEPQLVQEIPLSPRGISGGNLVAAQGRLLVATHNALHNFANTGNPDHAGK